MHLSSQEWELPTRATPRFDGHLQPNIPLEDSAAGFGRAEAENDPAVMSKKIESAVDNGVGMFLFDWYWYAKYASHHGNVYTR